MAFGVWFRQKNVFDVVQISEFWFQTSESAAVYVYLFFLKLKNRNPSNGSNPEQGLVAQVVRAHP